METRKEFQGLFQYLSIVRRADGSRATSTEYSDWFANDDAARAGFLEIMTEQGYKVQSVEIGFPCVVTLE